MCDGEDHWKVLVHINIYLCIYQEERVLPRVPLEACLARWAADEALADYHSAALGRKTRASKRQRLANFPPFLLIQLKR